jgi:hypothetical protein
MKSKPIRMLEVIFHPRGILSEMQMRIIAPMGKAIIIMVFPFRS